MRGGGGGGSEECTATATATALDIFETFTNDVSYHNNYSGHYSLTGLDLA